MDKLSDLTFRGLHVANYHRQQQWPGNHKATVEFRTIEFAGEAGELCEKIKKWLRGELGIKGNTATIADIASEMGDVIVCLDLLAQKLDIDLGAAVRDKFNETSEKYGLSTRIGE